MPKRWDSSLVTNPSDEQEKGDEGVDKHVASDQTRNLCDSLNIDIRQESNLFDGEKHGNGYWHSTGEAAFTAFSPSFPDFPSKSTFEHIVEYREPQDVESDKEPTEQINGLSSLEVEGIASIGVKRDGEEADEPVISIAKSKGCSSTQLAPCFIKEQSKSTKRYQNSNKSKEHLQDEAEPDIQPSKLKSEKLLSHYKNIMELDEFKFQNLLKEEKFPRLLVRTRKRRFGCLYFHFVVLFGYKDDYIHIAHCRTLIRKKHCHKLFESGQIAGVCIDKYKMNADGTMPKPTSKFFNWQKGVYLIGDFDPKSNQEKEDILERIRREERKKTHYSVRSYSCEHFAYYAMTGDNCEITQLDNMGRPMKALANVIDNSLNIVVPILKESFNFLRHRNKCTSRNSESVSFHG